MTGRYLRHGEPTHYCDDELPSSANFGDVWQCECGRRWIARPGAGRLFRWARRWLPWPRAPREEP